MSTVHQGAPVAHEKQERNSDKFVHVEAHDLELLAAGTGHGIYGDRLWLENDDGQALVFFARER